MGAGCTPENLVGDPESVYFRLHIACTLNEGHRYCTTGVARTLSRVIWFAASNHLIHQEMTPLKIHSNEATNEHNRVQNTFKSVYWS